MTKYGIRLPGGDLARVKSWEFEDDIDAYNPHVLTADERFPVWMTDSLEDARAVVARDVGKYSSSIDRPGWGDLNPKSLTLVRVELTVTEVTP